MIFSFRSFGLLSCGSVMIMGACGGKVRGDPGAAGSAGAGASSATGNGATGTTTGSSSGVTSGGGAIGPGSMATCESACQHIEVSGCTQQTLQQCISGCNALREQFPGCAALFDAYVQCIDGAVISCGPGGSNPSAPECEGLAKDLD